MAKKSKIVKAAKQRELIKKYYELKEAGDIEALAKLPLDAHPTHYHN
ncbi:MAG: 30S ribosomal protein S14, partial [Lactobacillus gasseri]|nr:30S ribosomal protein S14 [Lactobacillus gasseri]